MATVDLTNYAGRTFTHLNLCTLARKAHLVHKLVMTHIANFEKWLTTDTGEAAEWQKEPIERLAWYRQHLTRENVAKIKRQA